MNELATEQLLKEASKTVTLLNTNTASSSGMAKRSSGYAYATMHMEFVEAATWLLRSCGRYERAIEVLYQRLQQTSCPRVGKTACWVLVTDQVRVLHSDALERAVGNE